MEKEPRSPVTTGTRTSKGCGPGAEMKSTKPCESCNEPTPTSLNAIVLRVPADTHPALVEFLRQAMREWAPPRARQFSTRTVGPPSACGESGEAGLPIRRRIPLCRASRRVRV
jgi:hypothetical protein